MISKNVTKRHVGRSCACARVVMAPSSRRTSPPEGFHVPQTIVWKVQACSLFSTEPVVQYLAILSASARTRHMCVYVISSVFIALFAPECSRNDLGEQKFRGGACPHTSLESALRAHSLLRNTLYTFIHRTTHKLVAIYGPVVT